MLNKYTGLCHCLRFLEIHEPNLCKMSFKSREEKIAEIIWKTRFDKNKPNLPFRIEEEEVNKIVQEIMKIVSNN